jgi:hypothetical protein
MTITLSDGHHPLDSYVIFDHLNGRYGRTEFLRCRAKGLNREAATSAGRERNLLQVLEGLLILQTDLVDQVCADNDALP